MVPLGRGGSPASIPPVGAFEDTTLARDECLSGATPPLSCLHVARMPLDGSVELSEILDAVLVGIAPSVQFVVLVEDGVEVNLSMAMVLADVMVRARLEAVAAPLAVDGRDQLDVIECRRDADGAREGSNPEDRGVWGHGMVSVTAREIVANGTALLRYRHRRAREERIMARDWKSRETDSDINELLERHAAEDAGMCTPCSVTGLRVLTSVHAIRFIAQSLRTWRRTSLGALGSAAFSRLIHRSMQKLALCAVTGVFTARGGGAGGDDLGGGGGGGAGTGVPPPRAVEGGLPRPRFMRPHPVIRGHHARDPALARYLARADPMLWPAPVVAWTLGSTVSDGAGGDYHDICEHPWLRGYATIFPGVGSGELHVDLMGKRWCVACDAVYAAAPRPARDARALERELDAHQHTGSDLSSDGVATGCSHARGEARTKDFLTFGLAGIPGYELGNNLYGFNTSLTSARRMFVFVGGDYSAALEAPDAVAIATQLTIDRFPRLLNLARTSGGPVSAAVFVRAGAAGHRDVDALEKLIAAEGGAGLRKVALHVVRGHRSGAYAAGARGAKMPYPINALRNVALEGACSAKLLLLVDVDFVPSVGFAGRIAAQFRAWDREDESRAGAAGPKRLRLAVLPSFDLCKSVGSQPRTREDMLSLIAANCSILSASDTQDPPVSHGPTNLTLWLSPPSEGSVGAGGDGAAAGAYEVTFWLGFEPYYAVRAPHLRYDERMRGWGGDKQVHALLLYSAWAEFHVLRSDFLAHMPHERAADWAGAGAGELQEQQTKRALSIMERLIVPELETMRVFTRNVTRRPLIPGEDPELGPHLVAPHRLCSNRAIMEGRLNPRKGSWLWPAPLPLGAALPTAAALLEAHARDVQAPVGRADWTPAGRGSASGLVIGACAETRLAGELTGAELTAEMTCALSAYLASLLLGRPFALVSLSPRDPWYMSRVHMLKSLEEASLRYYGNITAESSPEALARLLEGTDMIPVSANPVVAALLDASLDAPDLSLDARDADSQDLVANERPSLNQRFLWPGESVALSSFRWPCLPALLASSLEYMGYPNITGPAFHRLFGLSLPAAIFTKIDALFSTALKDALVLGLYAPGEPQAVPAAVACLMDNLLEAGVRPAPGAPGQAAAAAAAAAKARVVVVVHHTSLSVVKRELSRVSSGPHFKADAARWAIEVVAAQEFFLTREEAEVALLAWSKGAGRGPGALSGVSGAPPYTESTRVITPSELVDRATLYALSRAAGLTTTSPATFPFLSQINPRATLSTRAWQCHKRRPCQQP